MESRVEIPSDVFQLIYIDEKLRNEVAYSHQCCEKGGRFKYLATCSYPISYIVTLDQKNEALSLVEKAKKEVFDKHSNDLLFCSMGCSYEARYEDDVCNHRIRTEFLNSACRRFFVEFGTGMGDLLRVDYSIDVDTQKEQEEKLQLAYAERARHTYKSDEWIKANEEVEKYEHPTYDNYAGLTRLPEPIKYTKQNILKLVNEKFGCCFKSIIIDHYTIHPDDRPIICMSPKPETESSPIQLSMTF